DSDVRNHPPPRLRNGGSDDGLALSGGPRIRDTWSDTHVLLLRLREGQDGPAHRAEATSNTKRLGREPCGHHLRDRDVPAILRGGVLLATPARVRTQPWHHLDRSDPSAGHFCYAGRWAGRGKDGSQIRAETDAPRRRCCDDHRALAHVLQQSDDPRPHGRRGRCHGWDRLYDYTHREHDRRVAAEGGDGGRVGHQHDAQEPGRGYRTGGGYGHHDFLYQH